MGKDPAQPLGKTVNRKNTQQTGANDQKKQKRENQENWEKRKHLVHSGLVRVRNPLPEASEAGNLTISGCKTFLIPHALLRFSLNDSIDPFYPIDEKIILTTSPKAQQVRTDQLKLVDVVADVDVGIEESFGNGLESVWQLLSHR